MLRFKPYDYRQTVMLPIDFEQQILPGTFEYYPHYLVEDVKTRTVPGKK